MWQSLPLEECIERVKYDAKIPRSQFLKTGTYPIVSQEAEFINGFWNNSEDIFRTDGPAVVFGDHTQVLKYVDFDFVIGADGVKILRPSSFLNAKYLYYFLRSVHLKRLGYARHYRLLAKISVSYPSLPEQKRIVAILDEVFEGVDMAVANAEKSLASARELFESYLNSVFDQQSKHSAVAIGEVAEVFDGPHATPKTVDNGPVFLGIGALKDGQINLGETRHVTPGDFLLWTRRVRPATGDVVFSYETRLGQAAIIPEGLECCLGRRMGLVRTDRRRLDPQYFVYQYISSPFRRFLAGQVVRGATVDRIALKEFPSFPIYLPNLAEQEKVVERIKSLRSETQRLEAIFGQKLRALVDLRQTILRKAFAGELTALPEDALQEAG